ncbi:MAG: hypothetical protein KKH93_02850 [Candidatus Omnitrophica bacterium]|nr:hypothetical protein [Candidatus Omnitrophota bacterium]MBU2043729.1 hypothetical protein [Candidatus Omnitrophota bacterium]MBU2251476.1 hypothetical protein [Candidatus Omnitrophota bacterium]MBU2265661.1 hypothetical protein [Candidatus Omnitrophota bacterium]MBU2474039.1 hypothetical protein [Candidatus Omnitrophota bacterium]
MAKAGVVFLKISRVLIGLILLAYSLCLLGSFFSGFLRDYLAALGQQYKIVEFLFAGIFSTEAFSLLSLFIGSMYLLSALAIISLKTNARIGVIYILFSIWLFIIFVLALKVKEGLSLGFSNPEFVSGITDFFKIMVPLMIPALFLPLLTGSEQ